MNGLRELVLNELYWKAGWFGGLGLIWAYLKMRPHLPHHHDCYVSLNGVVWTCTVCGKEPRDTPQHLAEVRAYIRGHHWAGPYMGPDRANYTPDLEPRRAGIPC